MTIESNITSHVTSISILIVHWMCFCVGIMCTCNQAHADLDNHKLGVAWSILGGTN